MSRKPDELDRVSAFGYSLGYLGGGLLFLVNMLMVQKPGVVRARGSARGRAGVVPDGRRVVAGVHDSASCAACTSSTRGPHLGIGEPRSPWDSASCGDTIAHLRQYRMLVMFLSRTGSTSTA